MYTLNYNCGDIPKECYDKNSSIRKIEKILLKVYITDQNIEELSNNKEDKMLNLAARLKLELLANIDAHTIWAINQVKET